MQRRGMSVRRACEVLKLDPRRFRRWVRGRPVAHLREKDLADLPSVARRHPHALLPEEQAEIRRAGRQDALAHLRHRKLTHHLSREGRVFCSESSVLRELRATGLVPVYQRRSRPVRPRPETDETEPNRTWRYDLTSFPTAEGPYHLIPVLDGCSRKIVGRYFGPEATSASVQSAWGKSLAEEGLLADEAPKLPAAASDRGTQMTSKSTRQFFFDLGISQSFSRARTPTDNASCESWMATLKCEQLYEADTAGLSPAEVEAMIDAFIDHYNNDRLHQSLGYVTPAERHDGRHTAIIEARRRGLQAARETRMAANRQGSDPTPSVNAALRSSEHPVSRPSGRRKAVRPCS